MNIRIYRNVKNFPNINNSGGRGRSVGIIEGSVGGKGRRVRKRE